MSTELPIFQALKVTPKSFIVGHPRQLVELLSTNVATAIVRSKNKDNTAIFECLIRCPALAPDTNLPVYICLDSQNQPLVIDGDSVKLEIARSDFVDGKPLKGVVDSARAREWNESFELAMTYWAAKMEEAVLALYPDRHPKQVDSFASEGIVDMKVSKFVKDFIVADFLSATTRRNGFPVMKLAYTWIGSKEDPRSRDHIWGMKFDFSNYAQFPIAPRNRKPAVSATEKQELLLKKRKVEAEEVIPVVVAVAVVEEKA